MEVPPYHALIGPTLRALHELGGSASNQELLERVIQDVDLPREVVDRPHGRGSMTRLEYNSHWARTYLKKYGLITNSRRGVWALTPTGRETTEIDPREVVRAVRKMTRQEREGAGSEADLSTEDPSLASSADAPGWRESLLRTLQAMPPDAFERLCQRLFRESGFIEVEVTGRSGDGGIDGHGIIRLGGLISFPVFFQCKRYVGSIGAAVVRDFRGAMVGRADKGLIITTGHFTREAKLEATRDGAPPIDLIDGDLLIDKLKELQLGVQTRMVEQVEIERGFFAAI